MLTKRQKQLSDFIRKVEAISLKMPYNHTIFIAHHKHYATNQYAVGHSCLALCPSTPLGSARGRTETGTGCTGRYLVDTHDRRPVETPAKGVPSLSNLSSVVPEVAGGRTDRGSAHPLGTGYGTAGENQDGGVLSRRFLRGSQKGGAGVGPTKRGKGTKIMAISDAHSFPVAISVASATPHEITLVAETLAQRFTRANPTRLIADKPYDSDPLDAALQRRHITLMAPHKTNRRKPKTQDGRALRRYLKRWKVERLFAWLQNYRRLVARYEYKVENFLPFIRLACMMILLKNFQ